MPVEPWTYADGPATLRGELHRPEVGNGRAVLVVHEADGIGGNVRRRCAMLAELGYVAAAVDMHGDGRVLRPEEISAAVSGFRGNPAFFRRRIRAGLDALAEVTGSAAAATAALGYCFGGTAVLELARSGAPLAAVASFHGLLTTAAPATGGAITARVLASTGWRDPLVPAPDVAAFQDEMVAAGADWHLLVHGQAMHSFSNSGVDALGDPRMRYDATADAVSWAALLAFLDESLSGSGR